MTADPVDFFISYTSADTPWAEWIAWQLEDTGHSTVVQAWDMRPGTNFGARMHAAARDARRTIAVLSPAYMESACGEAEWRAAFLADPSGAARKLVPVRVRECEPDGMLRGIVYVDVVGLDAQAARAALLDGIGEGRGKPATAPAFPQGSAPVALPAAGAAIFRVPVPTRTFVGREEQLRRLADGLGRDGAVAVMQVQAIHGLGGVGKTQLAARYARLHRGDYDVVWWLRAEQEATLRADLAALAAALGVSGVEDAEQDAVDAAQAWLERNGRWLLICDNAPGPAAVSALVPEDGCGHVLVTSRAHADWRAVGAHPLALDVWPRDESHRFLRDRTGESGPTALDAVAGALGDLPLALEQAAAYASAQALSLAGYAERLRDRAPELFAAGRPAGYEHTVATVWELAFDQIAAHPVASELLLACAMLAPEGIPRELLEAIVRSVDRPGAGDAQPDEAIALLLTYALLTRGAEDTFAMHRLVARLTREPADETRRQRAAAAAVRAVELLWPERGWEYERWPACERLLPHALAAAAHDLGSAAARTSTAVMLRRAGQYRQARAAYADARVLLERALEIEEAAYGPKHPEVAATLGNLGNVQRQLGDLHAARDTHERALAIFAAANGAEHPEVARTLGNLGNVQRQLGDLHAARDTQQRALAIMEAANGPEHPEIARTLNNLGIVQEQLGELHAARDTQQRALAIKEAAYGPKHPEIATTLCNLDNVQARLGDRHAARDTLRRALAIEEAAYGPEHPKPARTLGNLGIVQQRLGDLHAARDTLQRATAIKEAAYGPEHAEVARTLGNLGNVQRQLGDLHAARDTQQRALAIMEAVYGPEHPELAATLCNLGYVQQELGEIEAAHTSARRAVAIFERRLGPGHPETRLAQQLLSEIESARPRARRWWQRR